MNFKIDKSKKKSIQNLQSETLPMIFGWIQIQFTEDAAFLYSVLPTVEARSLAL